MGKFIFLEGPDFCGKTTQLDMLDTVELHKNLDVFITREPGSFLPDSMEICELIRDKILHKENTLYEEALLFAESRYHHTKEIRDILIKWPESTVISDRYIISSLAYQGYAQGLGKDIIYDINQPTLDLLEGLDLHCIKFNIDNEVWHERRRRRMQIDALDNIEKKNIHEKVLEFFTNDEIFNDYTDRLNMTVHNIDSNKTIDEIQCELKSIVNNLLYGLN